MKICGIIVEYNPLHNGHLYHLQETKKLSQCDLLIAIMSGNYTQRGDVALLNKTIRTKLALMAGVDVVIELPYIYAVGHADLFSFGAISLLNYLGVQEIVFGSEANNLKLLTKIAKIIDTPQFNDLVKSYLDEGLSYPESTSLAINNLMKEKVNCLPNDILAIQYIRQAQRINKNITLKSIKRVGNNYHDIVITDNKTSATSIRHALENKKDISKVVPEYTYEAIKNATLHFWHQYFPYLKYQILSLKENLSLIHDVNEGIENAIINNITKYHDFNSFVSSLISKRYTKGRIQRILTHILNHVTKEEFNKHKEMMYIRILGFKKEKSHLIQNLKKHCTIPIITNINKNNYPYVKLDLKVSDVYHIIDNDKERKIPLIL